MDELPPFQAEARRWLAESFPPELAGRATPLGRSDTPEPALGKAWRLRVADRGWGVPTWPVEYGGASLSADDARILRHEMERIDAFNPIGGMGVMMFGPTLLEFGTPAQKATHLPPIARGDLQWCQGFSEPGAGSDLASLQTKAEGKGDHWLVNGQKIWTSGADFADWCFCLVRTDNTVKHAGISFLIFDMSTPGIAVKPIRLISGGSPFCEMFLTDVKVTKDNLVGPLNAGWGISKRLLEHERTGISGMSGKGGATKGADLIALADRYIGRDGDGRIADANLRGRIAKNEMDSRVFELTAQRVASLAGSGGAAVTGSILKNAATRIAQERAELAIEILGLKGLGLGEDFDAENASRWLSSKASTIYGGSQEIQNNIIAKRILGLPDPK